MSSQNLLYRALLVIAMAAVPAAPAAAQVAAGTDGVPEFVPYVNDLQVFDQPDLSAYGNGPRPPSGYFGSTEYLSWAQSAPKRALIGQSGGLIVIVPGASTLSTGTVTLTPLTTSVLLQTSQVTASSGATVITSTFQSIAFSGITGTQSSTAPSGTVTHGAVTQTSSLDNTFMSSADYTSGGRFEFGRVDEDGRGWLVSGFGWGASTQDLQVSNAAVNFDNSPIGFVDFRGVLTLTSDGIDDDLDHDGVYGRYGADLGTNNLVGNPPFILQGSEPLNGQPDFRSVTTDFDDAAPLPTKFLNLHVKNQTTAYGTEVNRLWQVALGPRGGLWEVFIGPRGMNINDRFYFDGIAQVNAVGTTFNTNAQNWIIGGQLGGRWSRQVGRIQVGIEARALAAANYQHITQRGEIGSVGFGATQIINVQLPARFSHSSNQTEFAPGGELRLNLKYHLFRSLYLQAGYTALALNNVARGSMMNHYNLPTMGLIDSNNKSFYMLQGLNVGLVFNR